jgi:hypothetical protein
VSTRLVGGAGGGAGAGGAAGSTAGGGAGAAAAAARRSGSARLQPTATKARATIAARSTRGDRRAWSDRTRGPRRPCRPGRPRRGDRGHGRHRRRWSDGRPRSATRPTGARGPTGPTGVTGVTGPAGPADTFVRFDSGNTENVDEVVQCDPTTPANGEALGGGVSGEPDIDGLNPTVELSAPANASGQRVGAGEEATGWIGRVDWNTSGRTFTVYVICASPPPE